MHTSMIQKILPHQQQSEAVFRQNRDILDKEDVKIVSIKIQR
jgi:hypothetical protein